MNRMIEKRKFPWFGKQDWEHILFAHWRVPKDVLASYIPAPLKLDTFGDSAWLSIVSFQATNSRLRLFERALVRRATQINVRTYVTSPVSAERGVYFFSLHIDHLLAATAARMSMALPFHYVTASFQKEQGAYHVQAVNDDKTIYDVTYEPRETTIEASALDTFLTERYAIWHLKGNRLIKIPILHKHWQLQSVKARLKTNEFVPFLRDREPDLTHYSPFLSAKLFPYETYCFVNRSVKF